MYLSLFFVKPKKKMATTLFIDLNMKYITFLNKLFVSFSTTIPQLKQRMIEVNAIFEEDRASDKIYNDISQGLDEIAEKIHSKDLKAILASNARLLTSLSIQIIFPHLTETERPMLWKGLQGLVQQITTITVVKCSNPALVQDMLGKCKAKFQNQKSPPSQLEIMKTLFSDPNMQQHALQTMGIIGGDANSRLDTMNKMFDNMNKLVQGFGMTATECKDEEEGEEAVETKEGETKAGEGEEEEDETSAAAIVKAQCRRRKARAQKPKVNPFKQVLELGDKYRQTMTPEKMEEYGKTFEAPQAREQVLQVMDAVQKGDMSAIQSIFMKEMASQEKMSSEQNAPDLMQMQSQLTGFLQQSQEALGKFGLPIIPPLPTTSSSTSTSSTSTSASSSVGTCEHTSSSSDQEAILPYMGSEINKILASMSFLNLPPPPSVTSTPSTTTYPSSTATDPSIIVATPSIVSGENQEMPDLEFATTDLLRLQESLLAAVKSSGESSVELPVEFPAELEKYASLTSESREMMELVESTLLGVGLDPALMSSNADTAAKKLSDVGSDTTAV